jgi:peptide/nickel transport system permease protein
LGIALIILFAVLLRWLPSNGTGQLDNPLDVARHLLMPALVLATPLAGQIARYTRASTAEVLRLTFVRTARAKGLTERRVILEHVVPNALLPIVTVIGLMLPIMIGGAPVTEIVFGWPGVGRLAVDAASSRDYPLVMGVTLVIATTVVFSNLLIDILYVVLDPRVRLAGRS